MTEEQQKKRPPIWFFILVVGLLAAAATYFFTGGLNNSAEPKTPEIKSVELAPFTVNLQDPGYHRYLRATIVLEYDDLALEEELNRFGYRVRDSIAGVLRSKSMSDVDSAEEVEALKLELVKTINEISAVPIKNAYFIDFIVQ